jgi:hypothetical protein|tara:strand:+ start:144 stop:335 length:192 start_codon:yes stop_codon:yes gene_type:complete
MKQEEIEKIVDIRMHLIEFYGALDMKNSPGADIGILKQSDVAVELEQLIFKVDSLLKPHVNFE